MLLFASELNIRIGCDEIYLITARANTIVRVWIVREIQQVPRQEKRMSTDLLSTSEHMKVTLHVYYMLLLEYTSARQP